MMNLPEYVDEDEVKSMFAHADKDGNGYINYREFTLMCKVPDQEPIPSGRSQGLAMHYMCDFHNFGLIFEGQFTVCLKG